MIKSVSPIDQTQTLKRDSLFFTFFLAEFCPPMVSRRYGPRGRAWGTVLRKGMIKPSVAPSRIRGMRQWMNPWTRSAPSCRTFQERLEIVPCLTPRALQLAILPIWPLFKPNGAVSSLPLPSRRLRYVAPSAGTPRASSKTLHCCMACQHTELHIHFSSSFFTLLLEGFPPSLQPRTKLVNWEW